VHVAGPRQQHICICMHLYHTYIYTCVYSTCVCSPTCLQYVIHLYIHTFNTCTLKNLKRPATSGGLVVTMRHAAAYKAPRRCVPKPLPPARATLTLCAHALVFFSFKTSNFFQTFKQLLAVIKARRSIFPKDYTGELVQRAHLETMLEASNWAPTHGKTEPWRFVVLEKDGIGRFFSVCR